METNEHEHESDESKMRESKAREDGNGNDRGEDFPAVETTGSDDAAARGGGPWESGLRRRRRGGGDQNSTPNNRNEDGNRESSRRANVERRSNGRHEDGTVQSGSPSGRALAALGSAAMGGNFAGAGACGNGGGGPVAGVLSNATDGDNFWMGSSSAPFKPPTTPRKESTGLVAVPPPPSSITTAGETADITLETTTEPLVRRRRSRSGSLNLRRQYRILRSQIIILLGSASAGMLLFLFYALPLAAFVSLTLMVSSIAALLPVAGSILRARYEMEMEHPLGLTRYLPDSLRVMLTETTLHDFMTDDAFFMEHRYLLLYFIPGLQPEQMMEFIYRLPPRHRENLLRPGLGRMMPSVMEYLMRMDGNNRGPVGADPMPLESGDDVSIASGLTADQEHRGDAGGNNGVDGEVTILEAVAGLGRTLAGFSLADTGSVGSVVPGETNYVNRDVHQGDNSSVVLNVDVSEQVQRDADRATPVPSAPANDVIVELPRSDADGNRPDDQDEEEIQQQDQDLEGRILSEAASAAVANLASQASAAATETVSQAVVTTSTWGIRTGMLTGLMAGGGGIVAAVLANRPLSITLGIGSMRLTDSAGPASGGGGAAPEHRGEHPSARWIRGLFVTSAFGFAGAGFAYWMRERARAAVAEGRARRLEDSPDDKVENGEDGP